jgi:hypothetical protein
VAQHLRLQREGESPLKKNKKTLKNPLTNESTCDIIYTERGQDPPKERETKQ